MSIDHAIGCIAERQFGVIALWQLTALGLSDSAVRDRVAAGRFHLVHRGVYAVGHKRLTRSGRWAAAALACGSTALLAEITAAHHLGLSTWSTTPTHVLVPGRRCRRRDGIVAHACSEIYDDEIIVHQGLPCTSWARTILDLASTRPRRVVEKALDRAETERVFDLRELRHVMARSRRTNGKRILHSILGSYEIGRDIPRNEREELMRSICVAYGLPVPRVNVPMELGGRWIEADFYWPEHGLVVEVDGWGTHGTRQGFQSDRVRDRRLFINSDLALLRFDAQELLDGGASVAADIEAMLARLSVENVA